MEQEKDLLGLTEAVQNAFLQLGVKAGKEIVQSIAQTVYQAMSAEGRYYHTPQHALGLVNAADPIQTLAALFHDVVYFQVDQGFSAQIQPIIDPLTRVLPTGEAGFSIADQTADPIIRMVGELFGLSNQPRAFSASGSNEILSSIVMAKSLEQQVSAKVVIQIAACIEATIPFRKAGKEGMGPSEQLAQRLKQTAQRLEILLGSAELDEAIRRAVRFANQDVSNFSLPDPAAFLEGTWKLLPESYPALRRGSEYTLGEYREALEGMEKFIRSIVVEDVLHRYKGFPPEGEIREKSGMIRRNLAVSEAYLEIKLFTMAVFESLAGVSGGDAPVSTFLSAVDRIEHINRSGMRTQTPVGVATEEADPSSEVVQLLERGVRGPVDYMDVKTAPVALFIYRYLGPQKVGAHLATAREMFAGKINPDAFLKGIDAPVLVKVAELMVQNAPNRGESLMRFIGEKA